MTSNSQIPPAVRVLAIVITALGILDGALGAIIFLYLPAQEAAVGVFLLGFVHAGLLLVATIRGTEGGRTAAMALAAAGLLGAGSFSALMALLVADGKPLALAFLGWGLFGVALFGCTIWVMRRGDVKFWVGRGLDLEA